MAFEFGRAFCLLLCVLFVRVSLGKAKFCAAVRAHGGAATLSASATRTPFQNSLLPEVLCRRSASRNAPHRIAPGGVGRRGCRNGKDGGAGSADFTRGSRTSGKGEEGRYGRVCLTTPCLSTAWGASPPPAHPPTHSHNRTTPTHSSHSMSVPTLSITPRRHTHTHAHAVSSLITHTCSLTPSHTHYCTHSHSPRTQPKLPRSPS